MKLKMCTTDKSFGKICLKAIRNTLFQYVIFNQGGDGGETWKKGAGLNFLVGSNI